MQKSNPFISKVTIILFLLSLFGLLLVFFDVLSAHPFLVYFGGLFNGLSLALLIGLYYSFVHPSEWLFQYRYHLEGIFFALMIGSYSLWKYFFGNEPVNIFEIIIPLIVGVILGMLWINAAKYKTLKDWRGNFVQHDMKNILFSDAGSFTDSKRADIKGMIVLTKDEVIFSFSHAENQKIRTDISVIKPQLKKSGVGFVNIPTGIQLTQERSIQPDKFPRYWLDKIKDMQSETVPQTH